MLPKAITKIPGPKSLALAERLRQHESRNVTYMAEGWPVFWERAEGTNVWDADGNRYLDLTSAFGVAGLGHGNPEIIAALKEQAERLIHAMGDVHPTPQKAALCERLSALTFERWGLGPGKVILGNSGSDAVEAALKTSLLHSGKPGVIAFTGAYHGLGMGSVAAAGLPFFRDPFRPQLKDFTTWVPYPHCYRCPFGVRENFRLEGEPFPNCSSACLAEIQEQISRAIAQRDIGCILVEPVQGRGGMIPPPRDFLPMLRRICDEEKILLIADEIFTGFNRTGKLFACEHFDVAPDLVCLGKGLASGFPISACVGRADIMDAWPPSNGEAIHTSTFLGNPLGCAMALASMEMHAKPETAREVCERGGRLRGALEAIRSTRIGNIRGAGLMLGMEIVRPSGEADTEFAIGLIQRALADGIILLADGPESNVLSFTPPFGIDDGEIAFLAGKLAEYLR
ncbi:MAG TPA: aspartate aminotransferase family protein [Chthoniobacteraceae bacterium]|jgi:4-aminobutyrate aminotransferase-like enzyme|nr:aspartate aminotransferase family protein [Chthoniobacteraceae bacterium]